MRIRLFGTRVSPFVEKVARALQTKGLEYTMAPIRSPFDIKLWSPVTGKMPVIEINGERTYDSSRILRVLDQRFPQTPLFAEDQSTARKQSFLEDWADESLYWYAMAFRWTKVNAAASTEQLLGTLPPLFRPVARLVLPRQVAAQSRAQGLGRLPLEVLSEELARRLDELTEWLGTGTYFFGNRVSVADLAVFAQLGLLRAGPTPQAAKMIDHRRPLADFYDNIDRASAPKVGDRKAA